MESTQLKVIELEDVAVSVGSIDAALVESSESEVIGDAAGLVGLSDAARLETTEPEVIGEATVLVGSTDATIVESTQLPSHRGCCRLSGEATVLGKDKTFNLGDVHVTATAYENITVTHRNTGEYPIIAGPMFLHSNSDFISL